MSKIIFPLSLCVCLVLSAMTGSNLAAASTDVKPPGKNNANGRLVFVFKLLQHSSAARRIKSSDCKEAEELHEEATELYIQALEADKLGDQVVVEEALFHATETMFKAVRAAEQTKEAKTNKQQEFEKRMKSVDALLEAHDRISEEKKAQAANKELHRTAEGKVRKASNLLEKGKIDEARKVLDEAYVEITIAINELRSGDTLIRSLHFETKEEEYRYEIDRNDTHKMLVTILLGEKVKNSGRTKRMVQRFLDKAAALRTRAAELAAEGKYADAVTTMEQSTRELVRAIRGAGMFIPG